MKGRMKMRLLSVNISLIQLTVRTLKASRLPAKGCLLLVLYYFKMIAAIPLALIQKLFYAGKIQKTQITKSPVFILGHYRSGTTYLHKLLAADPRFGIISNYDMICPNSSLLFGKWLERFIQFIINTLRIKTSFFNNFIPQMNEPAEEDRLLMNKGSAFSTYWGFIFPFKWREWLNEEEFINESTYRSSWKNEYEQLLKQFTYKNKGKRLVLKNPPNTARIKLLLELFPDAKFIYIERNPHHVFYSMKNMWMKAIRKYCLQKITESQLEEIIFGHFDFLLNQYEKDKILIGKNLIEVKYEELEEDVMGVLRKIYTALDLKSFEIAFGRFEQQLGKEKQYKKFSYKFSEETNEKIKERWGRHIIKWESRSEEMINMVNSNALTIQ